MGGYAEAKKLQRSKNAGESTSANFKYGIAPRLDWPRPTQGDVSLDTSVSFFSAHCRWKAIGGSFA